ncbi:MAG: GDSL family lipase, partial [Schwartzia sp.]|nr:GDSL family lipase [Schwartzia sp. (in: firmicutes)]
NGAVTMHWTPLPYPCRYEIETFSKMTGRLTDGKKQPHRFALGSTKNTSYPVPSTAIPMFYQITAYGFFGKLAGPFAPATHPAYTEPFTPHGIFHYTEDAPASVKPFLVWHPIPGAVCYEVEILSAPPEKEGGIALSGKNHLFSTQRVYTNGWQADLTEWKNRPVLYWRVRALTLEKKPIGEFSRAEKIVVSTSVPVPDAPLINTFAQMPDEYPLLYPVYQWIPMNDLLRYEVELLYSPPGDEYAKKPVPDRAWHRIANDSFSCYDEYARRDPGDYYWRVRAVDANGETIGRYSETAHFSVPQLAGRPYAAAYGDSITHGGGALSYSPANREYDYMTYLDFPAMNLGQSGDTSRETLKRFDEDVLPYRPYNLIILTGSNDLRSNRPAEDIIDDLAKIKQKCEANDIRPIFLTLMPIHPRSIYTAFRTETDDDWRTKLSKINTFIRKQEYYIDLEPYFYNNTKTMLDELLATDGLHPDIQGKMLMAELINARRDLFREP